MKNRNLQRLTEIAEKLPTASDKEAFSLLSKCETLIENAKKDLVKKDFSLHQGEAVIQIDNIIPRHGNACYEMGRGICDSCWYSTKHPEVQISLWLDCHNLKNVVFSIVVWKNTSEKSMVDLNNLVEPPQGLAEIIAGLDGFSEVKTGMWSKSLGAVHSLAQARRIILPVWENTYNALKPFGDKW